MYACICECVWQSGKDIHVRPERREWEREIINKGRKKIEKEIR